MLNSQINSKSNDTAPLGGAALKRVSKSNAKASSKKPQNLRLLKIDKENFDGDLHCNELKQLKKMKTCDAKIVEYSCLNSPDQIDVNDIIEMRSECTRSEFAHKD